MTKTLKASTEFAQGKNDIDWISSNFKEYFYDTTFTLPNAAPSETRTLERPMLDKDILAELKPEPVTLGDLLAFLKGASHDHWYIFYVTDKEGILRAVVAYWDRVGWYIEADPVSYPNEWCSGNRVVSGSFSDAQKETLNPSDSLTLAASQRSGLCNL